MKRLSIGKIRGLQQIANPDGRSLKLAYREPVIEACRLGVAMGTAAVLTPGTELCHRVDVEELLPQIKVWEITN